MLTADAREEHMLLQDIPLLLFADSRALIAADIAQLCSTCQFFNTVVSDDTLWQALVRQRWPSALSLGALPKGHRHLYKQLLSSMKRERPKNRLPPPNSRADDYLLLIDLRLKNMLQW